MEFESSIEYHNSIAMQQVKVLLAKFPSINVSDYIYPSKWKSTFKYWISWEICGQNKAVLYYFWFGPEFISLLFLIWFRNYLARARSDPSQPTGGVFFVTTAYMLVQATHHRMPKLNASASKRGFLLHVSPLVVGSWLSAVLFNFKRVQEPVSLRLMTSQFKDIVTHRQTWR